MQATGGEVIAVDGKTACGSHDRKRGRKALHMVSAWAGTNRLVLGQEATEEKSNEITAIPKLLELLELAGYIVMIDAMGCQRQIAAQILNQGGSYVLGLKGNQSTMLEAVADFFSVAQGADFSDVSHDFFEEVDWITEELGTLPETAQWMGLRSIGMVERHCWIGDTQTLQRRFFFNTIAAEAKRFALAVRRNWGWKTNCTGVSMCSSARTPVVSAEVTHQPS